MRLDLYCLDSCALLHRSVQRSIWSLRTQMMHVFICPLIQKRGREIWTQAVTSRRMWTCTVLSGVNRCTVRCPVVMGSLEARVNDRCEQRLSPWAQTAAGWSLLQLARGNQKRHTQFNNTGSLREARTVSLMVETNSWLFTWWFVVKNMYRGNRHESFMWELTCISMHPKGQFEWQFETHAHTNKHAHKDAHTHTD